MHRALVLVVVASACSRESGREPIQTRVPVPTPAPPGIARPAPTPAVPVTIPATEIGLVANKTSRGGEVLAIGRPRFRLLPTCCDELVVRVTTKRVLAQDRAEVKQWDLADGVLIERQVQSPDVVPQITLVASADGRWVAAGEYAATTFYRDNTRVATNKLARIINFVGSAQVIAQDKDGILLVDPATGNVLERLPKRPFSPGTSTVALAGDGEHVWWVATAGYARWDKGAAAFSVVTSAAKKWTKGFIALRAPVAVVRQEDGLYRLDLATGATKKIAPRAVMFAVSPTGTWTALNDARRVYVVDTTTGREVASVPVRDSVLRIAFAEEDNVLAFDENGTIRIADIANGTLTPRRTPSPSRFLGWVGDGIASIEHEGVAQQLDVKTRAISTASAAVTAPSASALALTLTDRTIVVRSSGKQVAKLDVGEPPRPGPGLEQIYWKAIGDPTGKLFAVWVRRPDVFPEDPIDVAPDYIPTCDHDARGEGVLEYLAELWAVDGGSANMVWRVRPDGRRPELARGWPYPKAASGPIAFTPDGRFVLFGFEDGDVIVRATDASATSRIESLHRAPITRIDVAPGGHWVFTEDAEGEQRIWPL